MSQKEREEAAARIKLQKAMAELSAGTSGSAESDSQRSMAFAPAAAAPAPGPGGVPDYFGTTPNWAYSPLLRKFIDGLPGFGPSNANNLGQYLSVAKPDTKTYPGSDYYEIELREYSEQLHSDLPATRLRGYVQVNKGTDSAGNNTFDPDPIHYLGPTIFATKDRPVRVKFTNKLPTGAGGDLFLPVDTSVMGAGEGPEPSLDPSATTRQMYTQNRATLHLHGGLTPWISDGTPHQWITPAGEDTPYPKGVSVKNVPDMPDPGDGSMTFFYTNQQSARMSWIHDHSFGITRLNVYAGEASGYIIRDEAEDKLIADGTIPSGTKELPLIIQDKTFVDADTITQTDPTWNWGITPGTAHTGDLWVPHVYVPAQNPADIGGMNATGRWHYGPWFWPPVKNISNPPIPNPYYDPINAPWEPALMPATPNPSMGMENYNDTPLVNGTAYPSVDVSPTAYRLRILNAANDRFFNLQMYVADETTQSSDGRTNTEVKMVPANATPGFPELWPTDGRLGGVPDPATAGPEWVQIGTESGFLPKPAIIPQQPVTWNLDPTTFNMGNVQDHSLLLGNAERADVIVDFSKYAGKTLILYNDAPTAFPALDQRTDYFTGGPDLTDTGGTTSTEVGFGPNTRTIMQIKVGADGATPDFDVAALEAAFASTDTTKGVFESSQNPVIVPDARYNSAYNATFTADPYVRIYQTEMTFKTLGSETVTIPLGAKAIQDEQGETFDPDYGRMSAKLGLERPTGVAGAPNFILYGFNDPSTENLVDSMTPLSKVGEDGTQIWKITHNGVDTHPVHFHLMDVQLINRVGWDGAIRQPDDNELGWKETVRVSPLEDTIVALKPVAPKLEFGIPDSMRPLNPMLPIGDSMGFSQIDPATGQRYPVPITNQVVNFGWEYVWHCHILSHEEMDMMRPMTLAVARSLPAALALTAKGTPGATITLKWTDPTPFNAAGTLGNSTNEIGFRVERATLSSAGVESTYTVVGAALANQTSINDTTTVVGTTYRYRVVLFNAAGELVSNVLTTNEAGFFTRFEQTDSQITYSGPWATTSSGSLSGGSYASASGNSTATALVKFDGTAISLIGTKSRYGGIAEVSVDGGASVLVDFYAPATVHQQVVWSVSGLTSGPHSLAISPTAKGNPSSVGSQTYIDALDVAGELLQAPTRFQQTNPKVMWSGPWTTGNSTSLSGGSYAAGTSGAIMLVTFNGTAIDLIGTMSPYGGIAEVSVDGAAPTEADFYGGPTTSHKRKVWGVSGLPAGTHTLALTVTTRRSPGSLGSNVYVDAFDVSGTLAQAPTRFQQTDSRVGFAGPWRTTSSTSLSGGSYAGGTNGAVMTLKFDGTTLDLIGTLSNYGGISTVSLDGGAPTDVDFYGPGTSHKRKIWGVSGLDAGPHTVRLVVTSRRNASSAGSNAYVDAFDVVGTLTSARFEQVDALISWTGPWTTTNSPSLSGGSYAGGTSGATLTLAFDGTSIELVGTKSLYGGIATVSVDGAAPTDADYYGPATSHKQRIWSTGGLAPGRHTLNLTVTNRRNPSALGGNAYVDAFDIAGGLVP